MNFCLMYYCHSLCEWILFKTITFWKNRLHYMKKRVHCHYMLMTGVERLYNVTQTKLDSDFISLVSCKHVIFLRFVAVQSKQSILTFIPAQWLAPIDLYSFSYGKLTLRNLNVLKRIVYPKTQTVSTFTHHYVVPKDF